MNNTMKSFLAFAVCGMALSLGSCSESDSEYNVPTQQEIESGIIGKWKVVKEKGQKTVTEERAIFTYTGNGRFTYSAAKLYPDGTFGWDSRTTCTYKVDGSSLHEDIGRVMSFDSDVLSIDANSLSVNYKNGGATYVMEFAKVTADYSQDVVGTWEATEYSDGDMEGRDKQFRVEFRADGTYVYYSNKNGEWVKSEGSSNDYIIDGDWIAMRWSEDNLVSFTIEAWDINELKDGTMKWSALRENYDGSRYDALLNWKKVR